MVACPPLGDGPYGTNLRSAHSSSSGLARPKINAAEIENIFQAVENSQRRTSSESSSRRSGWFSRRFSKFRREKSESA